VSRVSGRSALIFTAGTGHWSVKSAKSDANNDDDDAGLLPIGSKFTLKLLRIIILRFYDIALLSSETVEHFHCACVAHGRSVFITSTKGGARAHVASLVTGQRTTLRQTEASAPLLELEPILVLTLIGGRSGWIWTEPDRRV